MAGDTNAEVRDELLERPIRPIHIATQTGDTTPVPKACLLVGWSFIETTGSAAATVDLLASGGTTAPIVGEIHLATSASDTQTLADEGVLCEAGITVHVVSGSVRGTLYVRV